MAPLTVATVRLICILAMSSQPACASAVLWKVTAHLCFPQTIGYEYYNCQQWVQLVNATSLLSTDQPMNRCDSSSLLTIWIEFYNGAILQFSLPVLDYPTAALEVKIYQNDKLPTA